MRRRATSGRGRERGREKTLEPWAAREEVLESQEPEAHPFEGTVLALQAIDPTRDTDLGGTEKPALVVVDLVEESPVKAASRRPHGKGLVELEAQVADWGTAGSWGETLVIWTNLEDTEL